jgi:integrase
MDEYRALLEACTVLGGYGPEFRATIVFSAWTEVRIGELQALEWKDIDGDVIHIRRARRRDGSLGPPKNGKARTIAYLPPAQVLEEVPRRRDGHVFHGLRGNPLVSGSHHYAWRTVRAAAGLPSIRWHDLRHFCATQAARARPRPLRDQRPTRAHRRRGNRHGALRAPLRGSSSSSATTGAQLRQRGKW